MDKRIVAIYKEISELFGVDVRVAKEIVNSQFRFLKYIITSDSDINPIRLVYIGKFEVAKSKLSTKQLRLSMILKDLIIEIKRKLGDPDIDAKSKEAYEYCLNFIKDKILNLPKPNEDLLNEIVQHR